MMQWWADYPRELVKNGGAPKGRSTSGQPAEPLDFGNDVAAGPGEGTWYPKRDQTDAMYLGRCEASFTRCWTRADWPSFPASGRSARSSCFSTTRIRSSSCPSNPAMYSCRNNGTLNCANSIPCSSSHSTPAVQLSSSAVHPSKSGLLPWVLGDDLPARYALLLTISAAEVLGSGTSAAKGARPRLWSVGHRGAPAGESTQKPR